jgi:hypothetical protein
MYKTESTDFSQQIVHSSYATSGRLDGCCGGSFTTISCALVATGEGAESASLFDVTATVSGARDS